MNAAMLLQHAAGVIEHRERTYGSPSESFAAVAARWSQVLGITVTPAQVALCLIDLKLARLTHDPTHLDKYRRSRWLCRFAARGAPMRREPRGSLERQLPRSAPGEEELFAMRPAAWRKQGIVVIRLADVRDDWTRQALVNEATRLYCRGELA